METCDRCGSIVDGPHQCDSSGEFLGRTSDPLTGNPLTFFRAGDEVKVKRNGAYHFYCPWWYWEIAVSRMIERFVPHVIA